MTYPPQDYYNSPEELRKDIMILFITNMVTLVVAIVALTQALG